MPSTIPESDFEGMDGKMDPTNNGKYVYDIKFEVVLKEVTGTIPGKTSLTKSLMTLKHAKRPKETIDFYDTNGMQISPDLRGIDTDEIEGKFCMETGGIDKSTLFFGCTIHTTIPFSTIKSRTIDEFRQHNIYFKIHRGGFKYGVNWSPLGFFVKYHPSFVDNQMIKTNLMEKIVKCWNDDDDFFDEEQKKKFIKIIDNESNLINFDPSTIPFEVIQTSVFAKNSNNERIRTTATVLTIPHQFYKVGISVMDYLAITTEKIINYIPLGYKKEEPEKFFDIVHNHSVWMGKCRNIAIANVPTQDHYRNNKDESGKTLNNRLRSITGIDNVAFNSKRKQLNVMVPVQHFQFVTNSIKDILTSERFHEYKPTLVKRLNPSGSLGTSSETSKYSAAMSKYQTTRSPTESVDLSKGDVSKLSAQTGLTWGSQRKIPKVIDFTDRTEFPEFPHPSKRNETNSQKTTDERPIDDTNDYQAHDGSITDTTIIQQAIDSALKKAYDAHRREIEQLQQQFSKQIELMKQSQSTASLESKFDEKFEKLMNMMIMMNSSNTSENPSPVRKKGKPTNLDERFSQIDTPTRSNTTESNQNITEEAMDECPEDIAMEQHSQQNENSMDISYETEISNDDEGEWITPKERIKDKKGKPKSDDNTTTQNKRNPKTMTQQRISDLIGGQQQGTPPRNAARGGYGKVTRNTPPRYGRNTTAPKPIQAEKSNGNQVILTSLSSSRSDQSESREREH